MPTAAVKSRSCCPQTDAAGGEAIERHFVFGAPCTCCAHSCTDALSGSRIAHVRAGGDLFDHKCGDLRNARALLDFKRRHPDRVHLLAGNRDLNKLRFARPSPQIFGIAKEDAWMLHTLRRVARRDEPVDRTHLRVLGVGCGEPHLHAPGASAGRSCLAC